ncbi:MAG TPA: hypothetical protein VGD56_09805 [Gemmatirosa sp.]
MPRRLFCGRAGRLAAAAVASAVLSARPAHAQALAADSSAALVPVSTAIAAPVDATVPLAPRPVGPTLAGARVGATRSTQAPDAEVAAAPVNGPRAGRPVALMVVGGAALILGAIIGGSGGTAVAVGGAVVGLIGLYEFIR